jgi:tRNA nucleotidyltransferase/poly(A) polymerase
METTKELTEITLPKDIIDISNAYINAGKDIFLVGGAVRDFIKGIVPKDWDLVTNALPDESKEILKNFNVSDEQGKNFGVLRVYTKTEPSGYEIASYRRDISGGRDTKGDDQKVEMGADITIEDDCMRRDFTINALFYDIKSKRIVDLVGGVDDIKSGIVRAVGSPKQRFEEDRLRLMRAFRFASRISGKIDEKTSDAIKADNRLRGIGTKDDVSQERIWEEIKKSFKQSNDYNFYLSFFSEFDMWLQVFPDVQINTKLVDSKDFVVIMSNLFLGNKISLLETKLVQEFKIEVDTAKKILFLISLKDFDVNKVLDFYKKKQSSGVTNKTMMEWITKTGILNTDILKFIDWTPSVKSTELIEMGFSGKALGDEIKRLEVENFKNK